jgi:hypothetical protein
LDWPAVGLHLEKMDILLALEDAQSALDEARRVLDQTETITPETDKDDVRGADTLAWLRAIRASFKLSSTEGFKSEFILAFDVFCERFSSCRESRPLIVDAVAAALVEYVYLPACPQPERFA